MNGELSLANPSAASKLERLVTVAVTVQHHVGQARRMARALAAEIGLSKAAASCVAASVSELGNNLFFHTPEGGTITLAAVDRSDAVGLEVIVEDQGPGIADLDAALQDGFSTNRGLGSGLPGVRRLMDEFEISSTVGVGTRIVARKWQPCR